MKEKNVNDWVRNITTIITAWLITLFISQEASGQSLWSRDVSSDNANNAIVTLNQSAQDQPVIVSDGERGAIIIWRDGRNIETASDIYGQRILESGDRLWPGGAEIAIGEGSDDSPAVVISNADTFFVAYRDQASSIQIQSFKRDGTPFWQTSTTAHGGTNEPPRIFLHNKNIVTAAFVSNVFDDNIGVQITDLDGSIRFTGELNMRPEQRILNPNARGAQPSVQPPVALALNGGIMAAWADARSDTVVFLAGLNPNGVIWDSSDVAIGDEIVWGAVPVLVPDGNEGAIIAWLQPVAGDHNVEVYVTKRNANGDPLWSPPTILLETTSGAKSNLKAISDGDGGAFLVWQNGPPENMKIQAQRIDNTNKAWISDLPLADNAGVQDQVSVSSGDKGVLLAAWRDDRNGEPDIYAQAVNINGILLWNPGGVTVSKAINSQSNPALTSDGLGGAIITWQDSRNGNLDIFAQRINLEGKPGEFRTVEILQPQTSDQWEISSSRTIVWRASPEVENVRIELSTNGGASYLAPPLFESAPNDKPSPNTNSESIPSLDQTPCDSCVLRITAIETPFIRNVSQPFRIVSKAGPTIAVRQLESAIAARDTVIKAGVSDLSGVKQATINYRIGGKSNFSPIIMSAENGTTFSGKIPGEYITERGFEYYINATDNVSVTSFSDTFNVQVSFAGGLLTKQILLATDNTGYRMISTPNFITQPRADTVFETSGFGAYDSTSWRLFEYRYEADILGAPIGKNVEFYTSNASTFAFEPGRAFWLNSARTRIIDFGSGQTMPLSRDFIVTLQPGWNQVGNPFAFPISWNEIVENNLPLALQGPWLYRGTYIRPDVVEPFEGYYIYNSEQSNVALKFPEREFNQATSLAKDNSAEQAGVRLEAYCGAAADLFNFAGIHDDAVSQWDRMDQVEPPPIGEYISLYFPHPDWEKQPMNYAMDYRNAIGAGQIWEFEVVSNTPNEEAIVTFSPNNIPAYLQVRLLDEKLNVSLDLREVADYKFPTGARGAHKKLKLVVGNPEYVADALASAGLVPTNFELSQNFPNPFNPTTTIRYGLPATNEVTIRIYDILGREVIKLVDAEEKKAGYHVVNWNARDKHGRSAASGVYFYLISAGKFSKAHKMLLVK